MAFLDRTLTVRTEPVMIYVSSEIPQLAFAAQDVKAALEAEGRPVTFAPLSSLRNTRRAAKVVIALQTEKSVIDLLNEAEGAPLPELKAEAFSLRTTGHRELSYWVIGGDLTGAMYGGLRLAEKIQFHGAEQIYNAEDTPYLKRRGIKFNLPLDVQSPTYFEGHHGTANMLAIRDVWDMDFWTAWFDEMARYRYNALSLWSPHPFTSMLDMEAEYPGIAIQGVRGFDIEAKETEVNSMSIAEKISFWQQVMKRGRDRGIGIYFINWNIFLSSAEGRHGLTHSPDNRETAVYMKKCMIRFLETYPDLAGFGITVGERMPGLDKQQREAWAWETFGSGMLEFAKAHPERNLTFIHRQHDGDIEHILRHFSPLNHLPNVTLELSCKYSEAHAHSTPTPSRWHDTGMEAGLRQYGIASWLEVRNDDFHFMHWAEPAYVRDYIHNIPDPEQTVCGFLIGGDGWVHTREFVSLNPYYSDRNGLAVQRTWLMQMIWGRLAYNPSVPDTLFTQHLEQRFPEVSADILFKAWTSASRAVRIANEQVTGAWRFDNDFWIERWTGDTWEGGRNRHFTIEDTKEATPAAGSRRRSFRDTAGGTCDDRISAWKTVDSIEKAAKRALTLLTTLDPVEDVELNLTLQDITAQAHLGLYSAEKFRAVLYLLHDNREAAREAAGRAYLEWQTYTGIMGALYRPVSMQRNKSFSRWEDDLAGVLADYHILGGIGMPERTGEPAAARTSS
jgi:hypothetical protein